MKLAFQKVCNIQKAINKQFPEVIKKGSVQTQCPFEGTKLWLGQRWLSLGFQSSKTCRRLLSYNLLVGSHCIKCLWQSQVLSLSREEFQGADLFASSLFCCGHWLCSQ